MEIVGIQKESDCFRLAHLSLIKGEVQIEHLEKQPDLSRLDKKTWSVTGIEGQEVLLRHLTFPLKTVRAVQKALPFQLEGLLPYPLEGVVLKPIYSVKKKEIEVLIFAIPKKSINAHLAQFQKDRADPDWVSAIPMALFRFASFTCPEEKSLVVFYVGKERMLLISILEGKLSNHVTLSIGSTDLDGKERPESVDKLQKEVDRALCFLFRKKGAKEQKIFFCGERGEKIETLLNKGSAFSMKQVRVKPHPTFDQKTLSSYAIPIGLGIDVLKNDRLSIQLRQGEFLSKNIFSLLKKGLVWGSVLSLAFLISAFLSVTLFYNKKTKGWIDSIDQALAYFEKEGSILSKRVGQPSLEQRLADLNLCLRLTRQESPLSLPPARISDFLSFLSSHPKLEGVEIEQLDYTLTSRPSIRSPKDLYCPQVRLVFCSKERKKALEFRDAILEEETIIDHDKDVEWKSNEETYEITFFLQNSP